MTKTAAEIKTIEYYLSDVDQYLLSAGVDPRERLDYIDEAADTLLQPGADEPEEEFGPAQDYAAALAQAIGVGPSRAWRRLAAVFVGTWLTSVCLGGLTVQYLPPPPEGLDRPFWIDPLGDIPTAVSFTFAAWLLMTPSAVRATGAGRGTAERVLRSIALLLLVIVAVVVWFAVVVERANLALEPASLRTMLPILLIGLPVGLVLIWRSRMVQTMFALLTAANTRPGSTLRYSPVSYPSVRVFQRNPPPPVAAP